MAGAEDERLVGTTRPTGCAGGESAAHRELKRLALAWARAHRLMIGATEVRLPRSAYRADVAAVFECKASRADFLRDSAREAGEVERIAALAGRLTALRQLIGVHRPDLRRGEALFPEFDAYDLEGLRHETHERLAAELRTAQHKLQEGTKFAKLGRWRSASLLYVVAEEGVLGLADVPDGWGLLVRRGEFLELVVRPCLNVTTAEERGGGGGGGGGGARTVTPPEASPSSS
jgi:hypothetical protein